MRPDANQAEIIRVLRAAGATVTILAGVGFGCPDLVVGFHGVNLLYEIKNLNGRGDRMTAAETEWIETWRGQISIVYDAQQALSVLYDSVMEA